MKKVGIASDNFKLDRFKKELTKAGLIDFEVKKFTEDASIIHVNVEDNQIGLVHAICQKVEIHFKQRN